MVKQVKKEQVSWILAQAGSLLLLSKSVCYLSLSIAILVFTFITFGISYEELLKVVRILALSL